MIKILKLIKLKLFQWIVDNGSIKRLDKIQSGEIHLRIFPNFGGNV